MNFLRRRPGKANIITWFAGRAQGEAIKTIMPDDKYIYGIPYSMINYRGFTAGSGWLARLVVPIVGRYACFTGAPI